jgi:hypothetical protein
MTGRGHSPSPLDRAADGYLRAHADELACLPPPDVTWMAADIDLSHGSYQRLHHLGIIERVGKRGHLSIWSVTAEAYERLQWYLHGGSGSP